MTSRSGKALVAILVASIVAVLVAGMRAAITPTYSAAERVDHVVVVGVPSLDWDLITPTTMPHLWALANDGAVGLTTARAARSVTCPWDGWLTLGAGNRARYPALIPEDELPPEPADPLPGDPPETPSPTTEPPTPEQQRQDDATAGCLEQRGSVPTVGGSRLTPAITENDTLTFGAEPGALGTALQCATVIGSAPVLAVGAEGVDVRVTGLQPDPQSWGALIDDCPVTLVATSSAENRSVEQLMALDSAIAQIVEGAQATGAAVIVSGISQATYKRAKLHALVVSAPGLEGQILSSPSTGRAPYSQLIDIAPTVLSMLGEESPTSMVGQVLRGQDRAASLEEQVAEFRIESVGASAHVWMSSKFFTFMSWATALVALGIAVALWRGKRVSRGVANAGTVIALLPASSLAANLFPWWATSRPSVAIISSLIVAWVIVSALCLAGPWRRHLLGPFLAACAVTFAVLGLDVLTGSHLQLNSPLGYNAIVAGRFTGFGNTTFAIFAATGLVLVAAACRLCTSKGMLSTLIATMGLAMIAMDGSPGAGADFGGVIALVPALLVLWLIVTGTRLSRLRALLIVISGAVVVLGIAYADYLRPTESRTHLGRFVGQIFDGTAGTIVQRKLEANYRLLTGSVFTVLAVVLIGILLWQWFSRSSVGRALLTAHEPYAAAGGAAVLAMAVVGAAVNDSGVVLTAAALAVVVPPVLGAAAIGFQPAGGHDTTLARVPDSEDT